jgi:hypothetical protein
MKNKIVDDVERLIDNNRSSVLAFAYKNKNRYLTDFIEMLSYFEKYDSLLYKKIISKLNGPNLDDIQVYLQNISELVIIYYILRKYNNFIFEPKYNGKKNPECCFDIGNITVNIEVKCPNYNKRILEEQQDGITILPGYRYDNKEFADIVIDDIYHICKISNPINQISLMDNKLKDYLCSGNQKFSNKSSHFNILVISLEIFNDLDEWYRYLYGKQGVFTNNSFYKGKYDNIDAILLTNIVAGHKGNFCCDINLWLLDNYFNLLFPYSLSLSKDKTKFYKDYGIDLFGNETELFFQYLKEIDNMESYLSNKERNEINLFQISRFIEWRKSLNNKNKFSSELF